MQKNLYITYSNQKARDLKSNSLLTPLDSVVNLDNFILEVFEKGSNFEYIIDSTLASSIIYKIIQKYKIEYFDYLDADSVDLGIIYNFIVKCHRNYVDFEELLSGDKLEAIKMINGHYQRYKKDNNLADIADVEQRVLDDIDQVNLEFKEIYIDDFQVGEICYFKSKKQEEILSKIKNYKPIQQTQETTKIANLIKPKNIVFDNIDEIKTALKISRKLLQDGVKSDQILIVASAIDEYAPIYKLFLDEYELKGFSSIGTPLTQFYDKDNKKIRPFLSQYKLKISSLSALYKKLGLELTENIKKNVKQNISIIDEKIGLELTEPNQIVGLNKRYEHIIFVGTDINHFPPKRSDTFLYSYDDDIKYFYKNNYFASSKTQLNELKRLADNLYIVTATYSGKRELKRSILIEDKFDDVIDVDEIQSLSDLALTSKVSIESEQTKKYIESITDKDFTDFDGLHVEGINASHLSASQINKYLSCPLAYLYLYKLGLKAPNSQEEGFDVMQQGSLMHLCFELFGKRIKEEKVCSVDAKALYDLMYDVSIEAYSLDETTKNRGDENVYHKIFLSNLQAGLKDDREPGLLAKFVNYYIVNAKEFEYFQNSEFEKEFALDSKLRPYKPKNKEDKDYFIKGFIDRFDNLENHINIVDYKSKKVSRKDKKKQEEVEDYKDVQLALYILYTQQAYQNKEYDAHLLSFKGNDKGIKFASLKDIDDQKLKQIIFETQSGIEKGNFAFNNSDEQMCGWCDMKYICHESVLNKGSK